MKKENALVYLRGLSICFNTHTQRALKKIANSLIFTKLKNLEKTIAYLFPLLGNNPKSMNYCWNIKQKT